MLFRQPYFHIPVAVFLFLWYTVGRNCAIKGAKLMSRLRYFLAAALVAGSMAVCAGAADTADRDALLETAVARERPETASMV